VGRLLEDHLPPGTLVATATAGSTPFYAPSIDFLDTLGLNDPVVASRHVDTIRTKWQTYPGHRKGDGAWVLSREPSVIVLGGAGGFLGHVPTEWFLSDRELLESDAFHEHYRPYGFRVDLAPGRRLPPGTTADVRWYLQSGLEPDDRPPSLIGPDTTRSFTFVAWLREGDPRVEELRSVGVPLDRLYRKALRRRLPPFCEERPWLLRGAPCEDGSTEP
jgi:hypothetical protein